MTNIYYKQYLRSMILIEANTKAIPCVTHLLLPLLGNSSPLFRPLCYCITLFTTNAR